MIGEDSVNYVNLDKTDGLKKLNSLKRTAVKELLTPERVHTSDIPLGGGLRYNWAAMPVDDAIIDYLR